MKISAAILASAATATAQVLVSNPGGAVPVGVQAPSTMGFQNATIQPSRGGAAVCVSGMIPVQASTSKNLKFNYTLPANQTQVTETFVDMITAGSTFTEGIMAGTQSINGSFLIGASLCTPSNNTKPKGVQLLTHGVGFDRYYWDFAPGYSYVDVAAENGYASFFYDRLGVGKSNKSDPLNVVQSPIEVEIARELGTMLRNGTFAQQSFSKVVGVGHSFGSIISQAVTSLYPAVFDAAILTGFSLNQTAVPTFVSAANLQIASQNSPFRFSNPAINNGYLVSAEAIANQIQFFRAPNFDPLILAEADANKGTVTIGEFFSLSAVTAPAKNFTGPVAVVNGDNDLPFCFGNCSYPTNQAALVFPALYPNTNKTGTLLVPTTGHGINLHYSATSAYEWIQSFIKSQGL